MRTHDTETSVVAEEPPRLDKPGFAEEALPCLDAVYRFALRLCSGDEDEAADVVQETFLRAYRSWGTYTRGTRVHSWLFTICRNVVRRRAGLAPRQHEFTMTDLGLEDVGALRAASEPGGRGARAEEDAFFDGLVDDEVMRAVDALPVQFREAILLKDMHDFTCGEIAEMLDIPTGTVKSRLHRGRKILTARLHDYAVQAGIIAPDGATPGRG